MDTWTLCAPKKCLLIHQPLPGTLSARQELHPEQVLQPTPQHVLEWRPTWAWLNMQNMQKSAGLIWEPHHCEATTLPIAPLNRISRQARLECENVSLPKERRSKITK